MTYAYRRMIDDRGHRGVELFISEREKAPPNGFIVCSWARLRRAWRLRDALRIKQLRAAVERTT